MKTVVISEEDLFELKVLRDRLEREIAFERAAMCAKAQLYAWGSVGRGELEREDSRAIEAINRILK